MLRTGLLTSLGPARSLPRLATRSPAFPSASLVPTFQQPQQVRFKGVLAPRRVKYRKSHKGRVGFPTGGSIKGTTVKQGDYGLRMLAPVRLTAKQLQTCEATLKRKLKPVKGCQIFMRVFPDIPVCVKGNETRMGKGKGAFEYWATRVQHGKVLFEIGGGGLREEMAKEAFRLIDAKLPGPTEFVTRDSPPRLGDLGDASGIAPLKCNMTAGAILAAAGVSNPAVGARSVLKIAGGLGNSVAARPFSTIPSGRSFSTSSRTLRQDPMTGELIDLPGLDASLAQITPTANPKVPLPPSKLVFGKTFTDHMLSIDWNSNTGWATPQISEYGPFSLDPSSVVFHYAFCLFEGMKAYRCEDGTIRLFRPDMNMARMNKTAARIALPTFDGEELIELIKKLLLLDAKWIPGEPGYSLYIRPTMIGTQSALGVHPSTDAKLFVICSPVGPYYATGFKPVSLLATTEYVRAARRGTGSYKIGANYSPGVLPQLEAAKAGYAQNLWLHGPEHNLTEVGTMNLFVVIENEKGETELITPPLEDLILPGVTRDSVLQICREHAEGKTQVPGLPSGKFVVSEKHMTMPQLVQYQKDNKLKEVFGSGTAAIVSAVNNIGYEGKDIPIPVGPSGLGNIAQAVLDRIQAIQTGKIDHPWSVVVGKA